MLLRLQQSNKSHKNKPDSSPLSQTSPHPSTEPTTHQTTQQSERKKIFTKMGLLANINFKYLKFKQIRTHQEGGGELGTDLGKPTTSNSLLGINPLVKSFKNPIMRPDRNEGLIEKETGKLKKERRKLNGFGLYLGFTIFGSFNVFGADSPASY